MLPAFDGISRALRHRDYRLYWAGASASFLGTWVYRIGLGWFTWELTESTTWLGIVVFVEVIPHLLLVPITGAIADRVGALYMAKVAQLCATAVMTLLSVLTVLDVMSIEILLVIVFLNGLIMAMHQPSYFAMVANLVPREDLSAAVALQSAMVQTARFIGPAMAGALIVWTDVAVTFAANALSYVCLLAALLAVDFRDPPRDKGSEKSLFADVVEGVRFISGHYAIRTILLTTAVLALLLRPVMELMPGFASDVFGRGADGLAWLMSAAGFGAILGSLWIAGRGQTAGLTRILAASTLVAALMLFAFAQNTAFWPAVALLAVFGLASNVNSICSQILVQSAVEPAMRARVMSFVGLTFRAVPAIGAAVVGSVASFYGLGLPTSVTAVLALAIGLWLLRLMRKADLARRAEQAPRGVQEQR